MTTATSRPSSVGGVLVWGGAAALLLLPAVAMAVTAEVRWTALDFVVWGAMLAVAAGCYELLTRRAPNWTHRAGAAVALFTGFFLVWINLAVGIIGSENNDANWMYAGVLATAVGGAVVAHGRSRGMAGAMLGAAAAQVLVAAIALAFSLGIDGRAWPRDVIDATTLFTALWLLAAALFARAGRAG